MEIDGRTLPVAWRATGTSEACTDSSDHGAERRATIQRHAPVAVAVLLCFTTAWGAIEWLHRPAHRNALVTVDLLLLGVCLGTLAFGRILPRHTIVATVVGINAAVACILLYTALVGGSGELNVIAITLILGGVVALLPLGMRNQLLASLTAIAGYPLILQFGAQTHLDTWYSIAGLGAAVCVAALGAATIESHRQRILRQAQANAFLVREANAAHEAKSEFLATIAHELRNPLGAIIGYTDLLRDGAFPDPAETTDTLERIHGQAMGMLDMLQNLLDIDNAEAGGLRVEEADVEMGEFLANLRTTIPPSWHKDEVAITWEIPSEPIRLRTDRRKLTAILRNLIHNAIKYTHNGSVTVSTERDASGKLDIVVADTGQGIDAADLPHIFDRFRQSQNPTHAGGVGLGLHIVKRFCDALDVAIEVRSEVGHGTTVALTFPATAAPTG